MNDGRQEIMKNNKGFTILELIIVIVTTAILVTFAVPSIRSWRANSSLSGDIRTLKADFEFAKSRAIRDNTNVIIQFNTGNNSYSIRRVISLTPLVLDPDAFLSRSLVGTSISGSTLAGDATTFDSRGRPNNSGGVTLSNGSRNATVSINMLGSIRIN